MQQYKSLKVELGTRSYDIIIGGGLIAESGKYIKPLLKSARVIIVTDRNVAKNHLPALEESLKKHGIRSESIVLPGAEKTKSFKFLTDAAEKILFSGIDRKTTLVALGGGVIGDFTGFLASILLRGVDFIQIPTTLLAMVDSSVGGKTGINSKSGKNLIGSFYQPKLVLADIDALRTLPKRQFLAGFAEVIKYGLINDRQFYEWLKNNLKKIKRKEPDALIHAIYKSCSEKAEIVSRDEKEQGVRALLNLGHTFGHALEMATGFSNKLLHGEGVAVGMVLAFGFSHHLGLISREAVQDVANFIKKTGLPSSLKDIKANFTAEELANHMMKDKKAFAGQITFILARAIGDCFITSEATKKQLVDFLEREINNKGLYFI